MKKKVYIGENSLIKIKSDMANNNASHSIFMFENEPPYEKDEYEIGSEGGNNDFFHVNEINEIPQELIKTAIKLQPNVFKNWVVIYNGHYRFFEKKEKAMEYKQWIGKNNAYLINIDKHPLNESNFDSSEVGKVNYSWDFDEDEYQEWLQELGLENTQESLMEYINDNVTFDLEYLDNVTYHVFDGDYVDYDTLEDLFGSKIQNRILKTCVKDGEGSFETIDMYSEDDVDLSNQDSVNDIAMKLFPHGEYFKGCRGFILTNGIIVYTPNEHNEIQKIPGVNGKFDFIEMGNIRIMPNSIDIGAEPTYEQKQILKQLITSYSDDKLYLDIFANGEEIGATYIQPDWRFVIGEIDRFYSEGIKPQGNKFYESKNIANQIIDEKKHIDINDINSINIIAKKIQTRGCSSYILTNGEIVSFRDHKDISKIKGMTVGKFLNLGNIRIGYLGGIELIKKPTLKQIPQLKKHIIEHNGSLFLDISSYKEGRMYAEMVCGAEYKNANPNKIINDILNYFDNGIKPQGNKFYESKINESINSFENWFGNSILKDENGEPIKMYHGTDAEFNTFSKEYIGRTGCYEGYGFNFTPFESRARGYNSKNVIEAYLKVENPLTSKSNKLSVKDLIAIIAELDKGKPYTDTVVAAYEPTKYGEKWDEKYYRRALPVAAKTIYDYSVESEYGDAGKYSDICMSGNADKIQVIDVFEKLGYDSVIHYDNDGRISTVIVFEPNQIKRVSNKTFSIDSNIMDENVETEVEAGDIKLDSFKKNRTLEPKIWDGFNLNPKVRLKLLDIADDFWDFANISWVKPKSIHLTGSICNFNWSKYSDIDLHIVVNFSDIDERKDFVQEYFNGKKNEWNIEHSKLKIYGYPVELYVEDVDAETASEGLYDLEENKWIKKPSPNNIKQIGLDKYEIKNKSAKLMTSIDNLYDEFNNTNDDAKLREIGKNAHKLFNKIKRMRRFGLARSGESDSLNVMFKVLRRNGYIEMLWKLNSELYDKLNSIGIDENKILEIAEKYIKTNLNEEVVADGNASHNPFKQRWKKERDMLKNYLCNYGEIMTSKENGKEYRVLYDSMLSSRLGINYCICIQWNSMTMTPGNVIYVRAFDKFTRRRFKPEFDTRGFDNIEGTSDDIA